MTRNSLFQSENRRLKKRTDDSESVFKNVDWFTVIIFLLLVTAGVFSIYAASYDYDQANILSFEEYSGKQVVWIGLSLLLGMIILIIDARMYETYAYPIYLALLCLLIVTIFIAPDIKGSRSWLKMGPMSLQPAEFAKFATALALAKLFSGYNFILNESPRNYLKALLIIFIPIVLILAQKETGSALVYFSLFFVLYREGMSGLVLFAALLAVVIFVVAIKYSETMIIGIPAGEFFIMCLIMVLAVGITVVHARRFTIARNLFFWFAGTALIEWLLSLVDLHLNGYTYFFSVLGIGMLYCLLELLRLKARKLILTIATVVMSIGFLMSVNLVFNHMMPHQQKRIKVALNIVEDPRGDGYNVNQSKIAIGSGGLSGKGFLKGTQTKLKYVPEQHTDFIFCTIGEEEGFIGTSLVVLMFLILILRVISIAERQHTVFVRVYAYCVASYLIFHFCINIGMVIGICPVIGIPLPFFSYGGSSLWGFTFLLFILLRLDATGRTRRTQ
ncbi:MAG: rod shape-determining protein RodA [Bacteroidales bacterium]|nr:rod shape-determining protein RodA [Bacteroidales bacterium]